ncbi:rod shape-determining protein MreD [Shewanella sp. NFH-SH190041]|uniref:rod shape-determining protein MreD n=1 Tax=Shewanella sp. NFH-SH190041 TaxID=2950245 RepID=UPI0021C40F60|nr:rod shape-determining protein MreD [Shewanella sp. NFH-SH190041]BDM63100.1 rod shape-determining protein MreD [Shewanella sp. NFH-SH190041]
MTYQAAHGRWLAWLTMLLGLMFQIMPLPDVVEAWRPDWLLLVLIYWAMALPYRYNILTAFVFGVALDVLLGATLGIRALAFSLVIYVVVLHFQRLRNFPVWQQSCVVALLVSFYHLVVFWAEFIMDGAHFSLTLFFPALSSLLLWHWVFLILRRLRRHYKVK